MSDIQTESANPNVERVVRYLTPVDDMSLLDQMKAIAESSRRLRSLAELTLRTNNASTVCSLFDQTLADLNWVFGKGYGTATIRQELEVAASFIESPTVIFDVGANEGNWSKAALTRFPDARVFAYEPQPNYQSLFDDIGRNFGKRFCFNQAAVSDAPGEVILYGNHPGSALASLHKRDLRNYGIPFETTQSVRSVALDEEMDRLNLPVIDILKIDVEGHELSVLAGAGRRLRDVRYIQFEFGGTMIDSRKFFRDFAFFFEEHEFDLFRISPIGPIRLSKYRESLESFEIANYIAHNKQQPATVL